MKVDAHKATMLGLVLAISSAGAVRAEDWVPTAVETGGTLYETDLSTLSRTGDVVQSWMRHTLPRPAKDSLTGKSYSVVLNERFDDCANRKVAFRATIIRDLKGAAVNSASADGGWQSIVPGSIAEGVWRATCGATTPPSEQAFLPNIAEGRWKQVGLSADKTFYIHARMDQVARIDKDHVLVVTRSDYSPATWIDGFAIRYVVAANLIDCTNHKIASMGGDYYLSSAARIRAMRVDPKTLKMENMAPGSFALSMLPELCSAAVAIKADAVKDPDDADEGGLSAGTAWGTDKGYLVTASHVITGAKTITVFNDGEKVGEARIVVDDPANDVAVLKFTTPRKLLILPIAKGPATLGRSVFTLGYPHPDELGSKVKMTAGQVSSTSGMQDDARFIQISIPIQQGNSGGPVIGWDGSVIGVVDSKLTKFGEDPGPIAPENVNYAVKTAYVRPMLEDLPDLGNYTPVKAGISGDQLIDQARKAVFMLIVER